MIITLDKIDIHKINSSLFPVHWHVHWINGILLPCKKNCSCDREKLLKFEFEGRQFAKDFEVSRTIYSNSERSEEFLIRNPFSTFSDKLKKNEIKIGKINLDWETWRKS